VDEVADGRRGHAAVAKQVRHARIDRDDAIEDARLRVDVELEQDRGFGGGVRHRRGP
jgi:hypothetical protein